MGVVEERISGCDVLLVHPPNFFPRKGLRYDEHKLLFGESKYGLFPPIGLLYLGAVLEKEGTSVRLLNTLAPPIGLEKTIEAIKQAKPKVIGITATTFQSRGAVQLARRIREELGERVSIGLGGVHVSSDPDFIRRFPYFDFAVPGEGEITFPALVKRVLAGEKVRGVFQGEVPTDLNAIPFPARHLINPDDYFAPGERSAAILSTRGCPFTCIFCSSIVMTRKKIRCRSPKNIVDEMEAVMGDYNNRFNFLDDTFTINRQHAMDLCNEILERGLKVVWSCATRASLVDRELLEKMREAGCEYIAFGVESGDERIRNEVIKKKVTDEEIFKAFRMCKELGIMTAAYLMMGFPTETERELEKTVNIGAKIGADMIGIHVTQLMPRTPIFGIALKEGKVDADIFDKYAEGKLQVWPFYIPDGFTLDDLRRFRKRAYRKFYFRPSYILKHLRSIGSLSQLRTDALMALYLLFKGASPPEPTELKFEEE